MSHPLIELKTQGGQSLWYDNVQRGLILSGDLKRMVEEDGILGLTSNPTIFEKAMSGSSDYDDAIRRMVEAGQNAEAIYAALSIEDIQMAADILRPVYERSGGCDGFVSLEVSPLLAQDTAGTIREARLLWQMVNRPNLMIKVPVTLEGLPAVTELIGDGINVNATLIFSIKMYEHVMEAYIAGLEKLAASGRRLDKVASVASFFVSRVDSLVDRLLDERIAQASGEDQKARFRALQGKAAIANARLAYARFKAVFAQPRFAALKERGARVQRPLWASTSTKNPAYRDVIYVENLIGPDTVNTAPPATIAAFKHHGVVARTLEHDLAGAEQLTSDLANVGIGMDAVTQRLLEDGLKAFTQSYMDLLQGLERKCARMRLAGQQAAALGDLQAGVEAALAQLKAQRFTARLWDKDGSLWKPDEATQAGIRQRLGWLDSPRAMQAHCDEIEAFVAEVKAAGFIQVLLMGMGGSSMAPELFRQSFGLTAGYPDLLVLDTTDPASVAAAERALDLEHTLFIVASKSGSTVEVMSFYKYFYARLCELKGQAAGQHFVAITDPDTSLQSLAQEKGFRRIFLNPPDIGGRYSALSYFGLLPAALLGVNVRLLLERAVAMADACAPGSALDQNPGVWLGAIGSALHAAGRDKMTLALPPELAAFGYWLEQLVAESTGKEGQGLLPVEGEPLGAPGAYGDDRWFVHMTLGEHDTAHTTAIQALQAAGQPVVTLRLRDVYDLGGEFFRWEIATVTASALMGINPLDQPNVQESKDNTRQVLKDYVATGCLPEALVVLPDMFTSKVRTCMQNIKRGDYIAFMVYAQRTPEHDALLTEIRTRLRDRLGVATTLGYGPRFLHSTGQLHKGGAPKGIFIQVTTDSPQDISIPGEPYTFGVLIAAQAFGDMQALQARQRCAIHLHMPGDVKGGLEQLLRAIEQV